MVSTRKRKAKEDQSDDQPKRSTRGINKRKTDSEAEAKLAAEHALQPSCSVTTRSFYKSKKEKTAKDPINVWDLAPPTPTKVTTSKKEPKNVLTKSTDIGDKTFSPDTISTSTNQNIGNKKKGLNQTSTASIGQENDQSASLKVERSGSASGGAPQKSPSPSKGAVQARTSTGKGKEIPGKKSKAKSSSKQDQEEDPVPQRLAPYYTPVLGGCCIENLSDEILLSIFSHLDSKSLQNSVNRICKRWNSLSKDKSLWKVVDLTAKALGPTQARKAIRQYCHNEFTKSLSLRAIDKSTQRKRVTVSKCLSAAVIKEIQKVCRSLKSFSITTEQICKVDLFSALPSTLTQLSLCYCNISIEYFSTILSPDFVLQGLKYLDLSGVYVRDLNINSDKHKLPKSLVTLKLRDSLISLQDYSVISLIGQHKDLLELDIGLHNICIEYLQELSTGLENLKTLNMAGCLVSDEDASPTRDFDVDEEQWLRVWETGFTDIDRLNVRNVTQNSGELMPLLNRNDRNLGPKHLIDTIGELTTGDWTDAEKMPDYRETTKFDHQMRCDKERESECRGFGWERRRRGPFWGWDPYFSDSDNYDDSGDSDASDDSYYFGRRRNRDDCEIM